MRRGLVALVVAAAACAAGSAPAVATPRPAVVVPYGVGVREVPARRLPELRAIVAATLNDPRGWALGGRVRFREVRAGGRFQVLLSAPHVVARYGGCSAFYSCAPGTLVLVNHDRWMGGAASYPGAAWRHTYRQMVVNHEVGHVLGFGHVWCGRRGAPAPVMQQQSKGLGGCARNAWPLPGERRAYAARLGVRAVPPPPALAVGRRAARVALGARRPAVRALLGPPRERRRSVEVYGRPPVRVTYTRDVVVAVRSRAMDDVDRRGAGVGAGFRTVRRAHPVSCDQRRCVLERGRRRTTFTLRDGRVGAVTVEVLHKRRRARTAASTARRALPPALWAELPCSGHATSARSALPAFWAEFPC